MQPMNFDKPDLRVFHQHLQRYNDESPFAVHCVCCGGLLLVYREMPGAKLQRRDCCTRCGQHYYYLDAEIAGERLPPLSADPVPGTLIRLRNERHSGRALMSVRVFTGPDHDHLALAGMLTFEDREWGAFREALFKGARHAGVLVECEGAA